MENDAERQLALIADTRARLAERLPTPWWYHLSLGLVVGGMVAGLALGFGEPEGLLVVLGLVAVEVVVMLVHRNRAGVWSVAWDGYPRAYLWALCAVLGVLLTVACLVAARTDRTWPVVALAVAATVSYVTCGRVADARWRTALRTST